MEVFYFLLISLLENPFQAAQTFIETNELSQSYLEEIANFIIKNAQVVTLGETTNNSGFADPFTGIFHLFFVILTKRWRKIYSWR